MRIRTETGRSTGTSTSGRPPSRSDNKRRKHRTIKRRNTHTKKKKKKKKRKEIPFDPHGYHFHHRQWLCPRLCWVGAEIRWCHFIQRAKLKVMRLSCFLFKKKIFWTVVIERSRSASLFQCRSNMNQFIHFPFCFFFRVHRALMIRKRRTKEKGKWTTSESEDAAFGLPGTDRQSEHFPWLRKKNTAVETNELGVIQFYWRIKKKVDSYPLVDGFIGFFYWLVSTFFFFSNTSYFVEIFIHFCRFHFSSANRVETNDSTAAWNCVDSSENESRSFT